MDYEVGIRLDNLQLQNDRIEKLLEYLVQTLQQEEEVAKNGQQEKKEVKQS